MIVTAALVRSVTATNRMMYYIGSQNEEIRSIDLPLADELIILVRMNMTLPGTDHVHKDELTVSVAKIMVIHQSILGHLLTKEKTTFNLLDEGPSPANERKLLSMIHDDFLVVKVSKNEEEGLFQIKGGTLNGPGGRSDGI